MTERFASSSIDLSRLPSPDVVKDVSFETIFSARIADLAARLAAAGIEFDVGNLETDPAAILQQEDAYRQTLDLAAINDAARAVMLQFATGSDLENLAAFYGIKRLVLTPSTDTTPAVMELDDDLRYRILLAPEALPYAGMTGGGYATIARRIAPECKSVRPIKSPGGRVAIVLLARAGNGTATSDTVAKVYAAFQDDEVTQLTDVVTVRSASITEYSINVALGVRGGPDPASVRAAALAAITKYALGRHLVGEKVYLAGITTAAKVGGVDNVTIVTPTHDIDPGQDGAAYCTGVTVTSESLE